MIVVFPVVADILCEFLEVAIHLILYVREVYPSGIFQKRKKYNVPVQVRDAHSAPELSEITAQTHNQFTVSFTGCILTGKGLSETMSDSDNDLFSRAVATETIYPFKRQTVSRIHFVMQVLFM